MPIRRTFRRLWTLVTRRDTQHHPPTPHEEIGRADPSASSWPARRASVEHPLTAGSVHLRVWSVGPYVIVAGTAAEAARALDRLATERDAGCRDEARQLRAALRTGGASGDALRVAV